MATDTKQGLEAALADVNDQIGLITRQINKTNNSNLFTAAEKAQRLADLNTELAGYKAQQTALIQELNQLNLNNNQRNTSSSADVTAQAATARDDSANASSAPASQMIAVKPNGRVESAAAVSTAPTNATPAATTANGNIDTGTNAETVTLTNSQGIPGGYGTGINNPSLIPEPQPVSKSFNQPQAAVNTGGTAGVGAQREDAAKAPVPSNATTSRLEELYAGAQNAIKSQDNILDQYASYTYSLSWYLLDHDTYNTLLTSDIKYLPSYNLLVQSGGAQIQTSGKPGESPQAQAGATVGRNPFFPLDFYIDNFEFSQAVSASPGSRGSAKLSELKFTVTEPNGISLQPNLVRAVNALYVSKGLVKPGTFVNYNTVQYCMVIRFYGYDEKGNLVMPINQRGGQTDRQAAIEKYIPFSITNIEFKVSNKLVEYTISALPIEQITAFSTDRGSIPQNFQFQGKSVKDILVGTTQTLADTTTGSNPGALDPAQRAAAAAASTKRQGKPGESIRDNAAAGLPPAAPPPKASYAPYKVGNQQATGLCSALNLYFAEEAGKRGGKSDIYEVQFLDPIISDASIVPPGPVDKALVGGNANANAVSDLDPNRQSVDPSIRIRSTTAGQQIVQFIDEVVRSSRFITDQQIVTWETDPVTQKGKWVPNGKANKTFSWYNISCEAIANGYDDVARCNVYRLVYKVSPYQTSVISEYFSQGAFRGVHKVYNYWFTGQNTAVLTFEQSFNSNWSQTMTANAKLPQDIKNAVNSSVVWQRRFMPASNQSREGAPGDVYEAAANAADMLYTQDLNNITLNIIGDPAWIPSPKNPQKGNFVVTPFYPDGTINYLAGAPYFEFAWNRPVDYNLQTGLMDTGLNNARTNFVEIGGQAQQSVIYGTTSVKSMFKGGKFTQELKGYWLTDGVNKSYTATPPEETARTAQAPVEDGSDNRFARLGTGAGVQTAAETEVAVNNGTTYQNNYGVSPSVNTAPVISSNQSPTLRPADPPPVQPTEVAAAAPPPKLGSGGYGFGLKADPTAPVTAKDSQLLVKDA